MVEDTWQRPKTAIELAENEVHVWRAALDVSHDTLSLFQALLTLEEYVKAQRFHFEKDRRAWMVAHGLLRMLLSVYTQRNPREISFQLNAYGKPALDVAPDQSSLQFNLSHSQHLALLAFTRARRVGVDVEYMRSNIAYSELAQHSFSPSEQATLNALPLSQQRQAFFNGWTGKEAYIKGRGLGLSLPLHLFDVALMPDEPAALLASRENPREAQRWTLHRLEPGPDYAATLAVEGHGLTIHCWQWNDDLLLP